MAEEKAAARGLQATKQAKYIELIKQSRFATLEACDTPPSPPHDPTYGVCPNSPIGPRGGEGVIVVRGAGCDYDPMQST